MNSDALASQKISVLGSSLVLLNKSSVWFADKTQTPQRGDRLLGLAAAAKEERSAEKGGEC
jgi:hypothetical protein